MKEAINFALAVFFSGSLLFGGGMTIKAIHDFIKSRALIQVSEGLSSSERLANSLTGEKLDY